MTLGFLVPVIFGSLSLGMGLRSVFDYDRTSFINKTSRGIGNYSSIPIGVFILLQATVFFVDFSSIPSIVSLTIIIGLLATAVWFWLSPPKFLHPQWYRWIQENHGDIWPLLREEAAKDYEQWFQETKTQEGLEVWIENVCQQQGRAKDS